MERMPVPVRNTLKRMARGNHKEICGFVMKNWSLVPVRNVSPTPKTRFEIDPAAQLALVKERRGDILGIYHSHPSGSCEPSITDKKGWPAVPHWRYWIVTKTMVAEWEKVTDDLFSESVVRVP